MKTKQIVIALAAAGVLGAAGFGLYWTGMNQGMQMAAPASGGSSANGEAQGKEGGGADDPATGKKVLYWHDPMVPGQKFDKPGKSPFMDMQLVPVYADEGGNEGGVSVSPRVQQNLGVRTAEVTRANLSPTVEAVGSVAYNERNLVLVQARSNGFVERLHVRAPLDPVKKGQPLVQLYIPDWIAAQEEYLSVKRMQGPGTAELLDGARQRMRLAGMTDEQMRLVEASGKVQARMTLMAPVSGVVAGLEVREGMTVMAGAPLFRINGLSTVWVNADVPESAASLVRPGNTVEARTPALPGTVFKGRISAILPEIDPATRTIKARIELANPKQQLVPGMFAAVNFTPAARQEVLTVPTEAVIQTGKRSIVMVAQGDGKFAPVDVEIGLETNGRTEIRKGLELGQQVVVSGQFLLESEASLRGMTTRMSEMPAAVGENGNTGNKGGMDVHRGKGKVESVGKDEITLSHDPIPSLQWGAMTMGFKLPPAGLPKNIGVGDNVSFELRPLKDGAFEIISISPSPAGSAQAKKEAMNMPASPAGAAK